MHHAPCTLHHAPCTKHPAPNLEGHQGRGAGAVVDVVDGVHDVPRWAAEEHRVSRLEAQPHHVTVPFRVLPQAQGGRRLVRLTEGRGRRMEEEGRGERNEEGRKEEGKIKGER